MDIYNQPEHWYLSAQQGRRLEDLSFYKARKNAEASLT